MWTWASWLGPSAENTPYKNTWSPESNTVTTDYRRFHLHVPVSLERPKNQRWTYCTSHRRTSRAKGLTVPRLHCSSALRTRAFPRGRLRQPISSEYGVTSAKVAPDPPGNHTPRLHNKILFYTGVTMRTLIKSKFASTNLSNFKLLLTLKKILLLAVIDKYWGMDSKHIGL